ncbi:MAG: hypothetical protein CMH55_08795 [Myxococcales bacterium]|nr:hypothetical protein [Myxococcales bacterium]|tara:strand:- start:900 stop:1742 length:843 start_codon:yes stop_codon:yes gene_type:complete
MKILKDRIAIITGASRGIGSHIAETLAAQGVHLSLAARNEAALEEVAETLRTRHGVRVLVVATDVSERLQLERLVQRTQDELGAIDLLINNAALERMEDFVESDWNQTAMDLAVNVQGPMDLTRLVLPGMLERNRGHIVNLASLAGFGAHPHAESYVTTKHAMIGFTRALRASLKARGSQVSASSVCPGFVRDVGMFARKQSSAGVRSPALLGSSSPSAVAHAVVQVIRKDRTEKIVNPMPVRPFLLLALLWPRLGEWIMGKAGIQRISERVIHVERQNH